MSTPDPANPARHRVASPARLVAFAVVLVIAGGAATSYLVGQVGRRSAAATAAAAAERSRPHLDPAAVLAVPHVVFRNTEPGPSAGKLAMVPLADPGGPRAFGQVGCERVYATASAGFCLTADRGVVTRYYGVILNSRMQPVRRFPTAGGPSRARVSVDGRYAAATGFVAGHSYAAASFSTATEIYQTDTGRGLGNLETFRIIKDGRPYTNVDMNFWGVTFAADDRTFYATLATGGHTYLVRGDIGRRQVVTLRANAECPSLSPDGVHLVYKKRTGGPRMWRFQVLDLATEVETPLPEQRSVDDQAAWLDNSHVLYGVPGNGPGVAQPDIWESPISGGVPHLFIRHAESPSVVR
ncbi:MAG TPA: hypothetical protein VFX70_20960 [Mycobacteriales bacterium]|nr:hypothetical protein [Mycobacteriales bacterium]